MNTIDAKGRKLGRVASEAAVLLMGKDKSDFLRNKDPKNKVLIKNTSKLDISGKKKRSKTYTRYSGHPGGLKKEVMEKVIKNKGFSEVMRRAVEGMLPKNKLKKKMMKNLEITE